MSIVPMQSTLTVAARLSSSTNAEPMPLSTGWLRSLFIDRGATRLLRWMRRRLGPGVGVLEQFSPRPLSLPAHYRQTITLADAPTISIVTPSFNQGKYLERTLQSVLGQDYPGLEFIVQDGGSNDESRQILDRYRSRLHHAESVRDRGQAHAINLGFRHAHGDIMAYLNSDDLLLPGALRCVGRFFAEHPEVDVVYGNRIVINENDEEVGRWILPAHCAESLIWNNYIPQETMFWRRRIWDKVGGRFDESLHSVLDWDLELRFHRAGARFHHLQRFLGAFRIHPQQKTIVRHLDAGLPEQSRMRQIQHGRAVPRRESWVRVSKFMLKSLVCSGLRQAGVTRDC